MLLVMLVLTTGYNAKVRALFHELLCKFQENRKVTLAVDLNPLTV